MIGVFDSGIGGLTVVKSIISVLPEYQIMYLGDTARLPYGARSPKLIYEFTREGVDFLFKKGCELIVIACNTASAQALRKIQTEYLPGQNSKKRVLGVIRPLVEKAAQITANKRVGVIGTTGTIQSGAYIREICLQDPKIQVFQKACPLFVPLIEEGWQKKPAAKKIAKDYLRPLKEKQIDALVLGCTHYQILLPLIKNIMGKKIKVPDPGHIVADSLKDYLGRHPDIKERLVKKNRHIFYATDITSTFLNQAQKWLGQKINLEKVSLGGKL